VAGTSRWSSNGHAKAQSDKEIAGRLDSNQPDGSLDIPVRSQTDNVAYCCFTRIAPASLPSHMPWNSRALSRENRG